MYPYEMKRESDFWEEPIGNIGTTPIMYALAKKQYHVVKWLEQEKNVTIHKQLFNMCVELQENIRNGTECIDFYVDNIGTYLNKVFHSNDSMARWYVFDKLDYRFARCWIDPKNEYFKEDRSTFEELHDFQHLGAYCWKY